MSQHFRQSPVMLPQRGESASQCLLALELHPYHREDVCGLQRNHVVKVLRNCEVFRIERTALFCWYSGHLLDFRGYAIPMDSFMGHNKVGSYPNQQDQGLRRQGTRAGDQGDRKGKNS